MLRHPVSRLSRHFPPAISLNPQTRIKIRPFTSTRSTSEANLLPFPSHCDKHDDIPRSCLNIQPVVDPGPPAVKPPNPPSTTHTDPQILVALGALTAGCPETDNDYRPSTPKSRQSGIDDSSSFERHTASLLDGLATICVHKPEGQVLALAMQLDNVGSRIRLTIAGNHNVPEKAVRNLESVWKILRDISIHSAERPRVCVGESTNKRKKKKKRVMEKPPGPRDPTLLRKLQHTIYQFTSKILLSRFSLHQFEFQKFATTFKKITCTSKPNPAEEYGAIETLIGVINVIEHTLMPLLQKLKLHDYLEESEWKVVCIMMDGVLHDYEHILDNEGFCEKWVMMARNVDKTISTGFSLRGYLEKITLLHSHIRALVHSAQSLRPTFVKTLSIHPIPAERRKLLLPKTPEKLEELVTSIARQQGYALVNTTFIRKIEHYPSVKSKVHCECLLVKHFHTLKNTLEPNPSSWNNIPPFSYIGVSKLSCQACGSWLKAYRSLGQQSFVTKGIHPKWSRSWGMPQLVNKVEMEQVQEDMARDTARKFCLYQEERARMVLLSSRTGTLLIEDGIYPLGDGEAVLYTAAKMKRETHG